MTIQNTLATVEQLKYSKEEEKWIYLINLLLFFTKLPFINVSVLIYIYIYIDNTRDSVMRNLLRFYKFTNDYFLYCIPNNILMLIFILLPSALFMYLFLHLFVSVSCSFCSVLFFCMHNCIMFNI